MKLSDQSARIKSVALCDVSKLFKLAEGVVDVPHGEAAEGDEGKVPDDALDRLPDWLGQLGAAVCKNHFAAAETG
jgi:hypothetical protein